MATLSTPGRDDVRPHTTDVPGLARELHEQLRRYIEAQYPIRHPGIVAERRALLETPGVISREPFIESLPGYVLGPSYREMHLQPTITTALEELATWQDSILPRRLYKHQAEALEAFLGRDDDLIVVTGTGSGKTETFLLPILVRAFEEARMSPHSFQMPGMRALILYPMNALVNDQLTRLRVLFGNPDLEVWFRQRYGARRPVRFGMYTSRTPYPGIMREDKTRQHLLRLLQRYLELEQEQPEHMRELRKRGRWPAFDIGRLYQAAQAGQALPSEHDAELYTRHQMQNWCPDIMITNYSMLEYMLMRPIERTIFQQTAEWLKQDAANTLLIVLDEAHLYSGVTGAEIALLLRRLQARLGVNRDRVRFILTSASLDAGDDGERSIQAFASTLAGKREQRSPGFTVISGRRLDAPNSSSATSSRVEQEAAALTAFDLAAFNNRASFPEGGWKALVALAQALRWPSPLDTRDLAEFLGLQLPRLQAFRELWDITAGRAQAFQDIARHLFPMLSQEERSVATSALLALAAAARSADDRPLLPVRAHLFFRGLPPVYACINPNCSARKAPSAAPGEIGALWLSPRLHCTCGARVYEVYEHRNCGALFLRAFSPTEPADFYWHEQGENVGSSEEYRADTPLLIGEPHPKANGLEPILLHIQTGRVFPYKSSGRQQTVIGQGPDTLLVHRPGPPTPSKQGKKGQEEEAQGNNRHWASCPVCRKRLRGNSISSLSTKGEQPFVNLVRRQFEMQPPSAPLQDAAPNEGRKVLLFSDGRQRAARLARDLPREVELDTFRQALLLAVHERSQRTGQTLVKMDHALYRDFVAVCAQYHLYFFDGESQEALLRQIADLDDDYELDIELAETDGWEPSIPQGYRLALLRQVADPFYSMQRMCAAVLEPTATSLRRLQKKPIFARLDESKMRALLVNWIEALLDKSAFDAALSAWDRKNTVPGEGFVLAGSTAQVESWNDAEKAAGQLFGYTPNDLDQLRRVLVDEFCEIKDGVAFLKPEKLAIRLTLDDSWYQCSECAQLTWLPLGGRCPNPHCGGSRLLQLPGNDPSLRARTDFYREPIRQVLLDRRRPIHLTAEEHTAQLSYRDAQQVSSTTERYELRFQDIGISTKQPAIDVLSCTTTMEVGVDIGTLLGIGLRTMPPRRANYQQRAGRAGRRSAALATVLSYSENGSHDAHYFEHPEEMISGALPAPQLSRINARLARRHIQAALLQTFFLDYLQGSHALSGRQYGYLAEALGTAKVFFASSESYSLTRFEDWLNDMLSGEKPLLMQQITAWLPNEIGSGPMAAPDKRDFVRDIAPRLIVDLRRVGEQLFPRPADDGAVKPEVQFEQNADEMLLLDLLFEYGFLPTYAFPREVRSFVIEEGKQGSRGGVGIKQRPQQSVDIALSEYAPGRELVVDKETYRVGGIYVDPFAGATLANRVSSLFKREHDMFVFCARCGYTQKETEVNDGDTIVSENRSCPLCQSPLVAEQILDPPAFAPERGRMLEPGQLGDSFSQSGILTQVQLVLPLTDKDDFARRTADGTIEWSFAEHRELLIANKGVQGQGFSVCRSCGAAALENPGWLHRPHDRPFLVPNFMSAPRKCTAPDAIWHGYLGHVFHSDLLLLRLHWPADVAYHIGHPWMLDALDTIAQALLLAATRLLDIATTELQVGWSHTIVAQRGTTAALSAVPRLANFFLFDTLSGGAGFATQVGQHIERLLELTQNILDHCPEQCERSCYRCLRNYSNRIQHHHLDRHLASTLLRAIIAGHAPASLSVEQQARQLEALYQYLELVGNNDCQLKGVMQGMKVPLLLKSGYVTYAIGAYPVQQERRLVVHPLDWLPVKQVRLFSDYELAHNLPQVAQSLLL